MKNSLISLDTSLFQKCTKTKTVDCEGTEKTTESNIRLETKKTFFDSMVEAGSNRSSMLDLTKSERYRRVLQYISSTPPRLFFQAIRCTTPSCVCECFLPSKPCLRTCETCKHGWVAHGKSVTCDKYDRTL